MNQVTKVKKPVDISIVILTKNEEKNIGRCLSGVFSQETDKEYEVIIIDSGSTDNTLSIVRNFPVRVVQIKAQEFADGGTRNLGAQLACGKYIVFLVADAFPVNNQWLTNLIRDFQNDNRVAGVYSRQLPKPACNPIESRNLQEWLTGRTEKLVSYLRSGEKYDNLTPLEKRYFTNFDNVSSALKRSIWEKIPLAETVGDDIDWGKRVLEAGYKIIYEPKSCVYHSHDYTIKFIFKRSFLNQKFDRKLFGLIYYRNGKEIRRTILSGIINNIRTIGQSSINFFKKVGWYLYNPFLVSAQMLGIYLAIIGEEKKEDLVFDFIRNLGKGKIKRRDRRLVSTDCFNIRGVIKHVLFLHPPARIDFRVKPPSNCYLQFNIGLSPKVWSPDKGEGVTFEIKIKVGRNIESLFSRYIDPKNNPGDRRWFFERIDLKKYSNKRVRISFATSAKNTQYAWAGWGEPVMSSNSPVKSLFIEELRSKFLAKIIHWIERTPNRHP